MAELAFRMAMRTRSHCGGRSRPRSSSTRVVVKEAGDIHIYTPEEGRRVPIDAPARPRAILLRAAPALPPPAPAAPGRRPLPAVPAVQTAPAAPAVQTAPVAPVGPAALVACLPRGAAARRSPNRGRRPGLEYSPPAGLPTASAPEELAPAAPAPGSFHPATVSPTPGSARPRGARPGSARPR
eukprot:XP_020400941.1 oleosin-B6-like [Zea mays]